MDMSGTFLYRDEGETLKSTTITWSNELCRSTLSEAVEIIAEYNDVDTQQAAAQLFERITEYDHIRALDIVDIRELTQDKWSLLQIVAEDDGKVVILYNPSTGKHSKHHASLDRNLQESLKKQNGVSAYFDALNPHYIRTWMPDCLLDSHVEQVVDISL